MLPPSALASLFYILVYLQAFRPASLAVQGYILVVVPYTCLPALATAVNFVTWIQITP